MLEPMGRASMISVILVVPTNRHREGAPLCCRDLPPKSKRRAKLINRRHRERLDLYAAEKCQLHLSLYLLLARRIYQRICRLNQTLREAKKQSVPQAPRLVT